MLPVEQRLILMAEDDDNDVFFLERALKQAEIAHPLHRVRNGEEAIAYLRGDGPYHDRKQFPAAAIPTARLENAAQDGFEVIEWVRGPSPGSSGCRSWSSPPRARTPTWTAPDSAPTPAAPSSPSSSRNLVEMVRALNSFWLSFADRTCPSSRALHEAIGAPNAAGIIDVACRRPWPKRCTGSKPCSKPEASRSSRALIRPARRRRRV